MEGNIVEWILRLAVTVITAITVIIGWDRGRRWHYKRKGRDRRVNGSSGTVIVNPGVSKEDLKMVTDKCKEHERETKENHDDILIMKGEVKAIGQKLNRNCTENKSDHTRLFSLIEDLIRKVG